MRLPSILCYVSVALMGLLMLATRYARADEWDQRTIVTFSGPVEIPGQVLPAGTYVFKVADSQSDRNIVEVFNKRESHLYGIFLAIPDYHLRPSGKTIISFEERAAGAPEAVKAWFYPGDNYGHEFVYPKVRAAQLAQANQQPVPSMPNEVATNRASVPAMKQAPLKAQQPNQTETNIVQAFPPQQTQQAPPPNQQVYNNPPAALPQTLPRTGSDLFLIGLIGMASLAGAGVLRYAAKVR